MVQTSQQTILVKSPLQADRLIIILAMGNLALLMCLLATVVISHISSQDTGCSGNAPLNYLLCTISYIVFKK